MENDQLHKLRIARKEFVPVHLPTDLGWDRLLGIARLRTNHGVRRFCLHRVGRIRLDCSGTVEGVARQKREGTLASVSKNSVVGVDVVVPPWRAIRC